MAHKYGLLFDGGRSGAMADIYQALHDSGTSPEEMINAMGRTSSAVSASTGKVKKGLLRGQNLANEMFRLEDEWVKMAAFVTEAKFHLRMHTGKNDILQRAQRGESITKEEQAALEAAMASAAEATMDRYPTFSRASNQIKRISRSPILGAFPTFASEMIRTSVNDLVYMAHMARGRTYDGKEIPKAQRGRAKARALALLINQIVLQSATAAVGKAMAVEAFERAAQWLDDDEDKEAKDDLMTIAAGGGANKKIFGGILPTWLEGTYSFVSDVDDEGNAKITNLSYLNPYGAITTELIKYQEAVKEAIEADDPDLAEAIALGAVRAFLGVFGNDEVLAGSAYDRLTRRGGTRTYSGTEWTTRLGNAIEDSIDRLAPESAGVQILGSIAGAIPEVNPLREASRFVTNAYEAADELIQADDDRPSVAYDIAGAAVWQALGVKRKAYNFTEHFARYTKPRIKKVGEQTTLMKDGLAQSTADSYEDFAGEYRHFNGFRYNAFEDVSRAIFSATVGLGRTGFEVSEELKEAGLTDSAGGIPKSNFFSGKYAPMEPGEFRDHLQNPDGLYRDMEQERINQLYEWYNKAYYSAEENVY
jgi:hypothetical protein